MNYFLDIPSFSTFYSGKNEDDEKPSPELKTTETRIEERVIKKGIRRKQDDETSLTLSLDETMGSTPRKEKSSWPDWQFWRRNDGSGGPFSAFRKSAKSTTTTTQQGAFTFRKDINDSVKVDKNDVATEHASNIRGQKTAVENKQRKSEGTKINVRVNEGEKDDPLVSHKESKGSKHVVINMNKVESMAGRNDGQTTHNAISANIMEEKYSKNGQTGNIANIRSLKGTKVTQSPPRNFNNTQNTEIVSKQQNIGQNTTSSSRVAAKFKSAQSNSDEKPHGNECRDTCGECSKKNNQGNVSCKTMKNSVIPVPRLNPKQVAEKQQSEPKPNEITSKSACSEQVKLNNVLKKDPLKPLSGISAPAPNLSDTGSVEPKVPIEKAGAEGNSPALIKDVNNQPGTELLVSAKSEGTISKKHTSQKASRRHNVLHHGRIRGSFPQKPNPFENSRPPKTLQTIEEKKIEKSKETSCNETISRKPNNSIQQKAAVIMKDVSTATPPRCARVDVEVQVPCEECLDSDDVSAVGIDVVDETVDLLKKRPWDTERVLKMQVLLDEKQVVIGRLKDAGRRQRDELKASRRRCVDLEKIINQANMEEKPQLVIQINELTDIKNELVEEISRLTVDIERERTNVKILKNELVELKGQLNAARKKNVNCSGQ